MSMTTKFLAVGTVLSVALSAQFLSNNFDLPSPMNVAVAQDSKFVEKDEFEAMVTKYLLENPEVITNALEMAQIRQEERELAMAAAAITDQADLIYASTGSPVMGNAEGDATIVEFFDYQCGYCKRAATGLFAASKADGNVRIVLKEFPILGPASLVAAKAALAAKNQGKYDEMHMALINFKGRLSESAIKGIARDQGLDVLKLELDMDSPSVQKEIAETRALAQSLGINGTPAFIVNDTLVPGAVPTEQLMQLVAEERG
ncbi:MAG: DsbA family protein [Alphaproteobacteria bacterium]